MNDGQKFAPIMEEAWQKAIGLVNFTRGQQAEPGLIIDRPQHDGTKITVAYFAPPTEEDRSAIDVRFNFRPTLAMPGDYLILSSTEQLATAIMDGLAQEVKQATKPVAGMHSLVDIDGGHLASILAANRETLIRNNMVEEGHSRSEAERDIGVLLLIAEHITKVKLSIGSDQSQSKASLQVQLALPDA
jgi:hypothetical protein